MNILLLTDHFLPTIGGGEFIAHYWAHSLTRRGHRVVIPTLRSFRRSTRAAMRFPYTVDERITIPYLQSLSRMLQYRHLVKRYAFDVVHCNFLYPVGMWGVRLQRLFQIPMVASGQGADILTYEPLGYGNLRDPRVIEATKVVIRNATTLIYNCERVKQEMMILGAIPAQLERLRNGTTWAAFEGDKNDNLRRKLGVKDSELLFTAISRHSPIKGLTVLVDAVAQLREMQGFKLLLAGPRTEKLIPRIHELGIQDKCVVVGELELAFEPETNIPRMPSPAIIEHLKASDVFVSPALSGTYELSNADAMSAGLAVIVSDNIGNKDSVVDGENGFVARNGDAKSYADAMRKLILNRSLAKAMGVRNRQISRDLDWDVLAVQLESIYQRAMEKFRMRDSLRT